MRYRFDDRPRMLPAVILGGGAWVAMEKLGPVMTENVINWPSAVAAVVCAACAANVVGEGCRLLADGLDLLIAARVPKGNKGSAGWASWWSLRKDILHTGWGPYWGVYAQGFFNRGKPIFADYASNAVTFGTAGSGKGVGVLLPTCMTIRESKFLTDLKGVNSCMLQEPLEARGEILRKLNIGGQHLDILGEGDYYNPLENIIARNFKRPGGLQDVTSDTAELCLQLYPEPADNGGKGDDKYWRDGGRDIMGFGTQQSVLVHGDAATLGDMNQLLNNKEQLLNEALWAAGRLEDKDGKLLPPMPIENSPWVKLHDSQEDVQNYIAYYRAKASSIADLLLASDSKTADSFLTGARQAMAPYNITTRAHKVLSKSTFNFSQLKEGDKRITAAIIVDASRLGTQSKIASLLQWCAMTELKRHPDKKRPVYFITDECTNFKIQDLPSLQTWGRELGIRWHGFVQSLAAYEKTYGIHGVRTLLSETEVKQFLPNTREPELLALIEKLLGEQSIIAKNHSGNRDRFGVSGFGYQEEGKPLMRAEEIRRTDKTILIIRKNKPILTSLPPVASIHPLRVQIGINPYHGKPFLKRITLRLGNRKGNPIIRLFWSIVSKGGAS